MSTPQREMSEKCLECDGPADHPPRSSACKRVKTLLGAALGEQTYHSFVNHNFKIACALEQRAKKAEARVKELEELIKDLQDERDRLTREPTYDWNFTE